MGSGVFLRYYDLSRGLASTMGRALIGSFVEGIWHTGLEVHDCEYFFGGGGVQRMRPEDFEREHALKPAKIVKLGETCKTAADMDAFVREVGPRFTAFTYDLLEWNCNHFTNECSKFLLDGRGIPDEVLRQHKVLEGSPMGKIILSMIQNANMANPVGGPGAHDQAAVLSQAESLASLSSSQMQQRSPSPSQHSSTPSTVCTDAASQSSSSPFSPASPPVAPSQFSAALSDLLARSTGSEAAVATLRCLEDATSRVISHATSPPERQLSKTETAIRDLCSSEEGVLTLMALGFQETDEGDAWDVPSPNAAALRTLVEARALVRLELQRRQAAQQSQQPQRWESQMRVLGKMGFTDRAACMRALQAANGNVNGALDRLLH